MKNKIINITLTVILLLTIAMPTFATNGILDKENGITASIDGVAPTVSTMASTMLGYVMWAAWAIALGMCIYLGIKYMMSSAQERARVKDNAIRYLIGVLIIAGSVTIFKIIMNVVAGSMGGAMVE